MESYTGKLIPSLTKYESYMINCFNPFRSIYHANGGGHLKITTGDAFVKFLEFTAMIIL